MIEPSDDESDEEHDESKSKSDEDIHIPEPARDAQLEEIYKLERKDAGSDENDSDDEDDENDDEETKEKNRKRREEVNPSLTCLCS